MIKSRYYFYPIFINEKNETVIIECDGYIPIKPGDPVLDENGNDYRVVDPQDPMSTKISRIIKSNGDIIMEIPCMTVASLAVSKTPYLSD